MWTTLPSRPLVCVELSALNYPILIASHQHQVHRGLDSWLGLAVPQTHQVGQGRVRSGRARRQASSLAPQESLHSLWCLRCSLVLSAPRYPLSSRFRCANTDMHIPAGPHNHGEGAVLQVLAIHAKWGESLAKSFILQGGSGKLCSDPKSLGCVLDKRVGVLSASWWWYALRGWVP